ncbi:trypsin-like peptidase domain-containing protein [uncultured Roseovarius sp.]|uniref:trypsin-like peptidase domain-containing protein n=1 Tax=uncultured Roseovarius sp. TaxID=293344 RepID=UPI002630EE06|nr:trypsin-like peptidase domain-containing protein [uncultured Roseovarius sp.]
MARIVLGFILVVFMAVPAVRAQDEPLVWVQIEAKASLNEAQLAARGYAADLTDVNGFSLGRGWYAIALGPYRRDEAERVLQVYRAEGVIAPDSYIAESSDYEQQFWPIGANLLDQPAPVAPDSPPEIADAPAPLPEPEPVLETPQEARASERLLSRAEREELQVALKWAGFYAGRIDAAFGRGTRAAMARWQDANGFDITGILTTRQRADLLTQYNAVFDGLGLEIVRDNATGIAMEMPTDVVEFDRYEPPFAHFNATGDIDARVLLISQQGDRATLGGLYDIMQTLEIVPETGPRTLDDDSFTLIGEGALQISQTQVWLRDGQVKGFTLIWPAGDEARRTRLLDRMQDSFEWLPGTLDPAEGRGEQSIDLVSGLEIRQPKLSRSGFFVDAGGAVLTTAEAVRNCGRITIDESYEADVTLTDDGIGVAILKPRQRLAPLEVATFQEITPRLQSDVAVAGYSYGGILGAPTLTYGQLSDLRGLNGESHLKRLALNALEGDAGGPVLDTGGAVLGMLLPQSRDGGRVLPDDVSFAATNGALQDVLSRGGITPRTTSGQDRISPEALTDRASAMTALVSCWE